MTVQYSLTRRYAGVAAPPPPVLGDVLTIEEVSYDMFNPVHRDDGRLKDGIVLGQAPWGKHEAFPVGGNTAWDWYHGARWGENPPWNDNMIPWGQLFAANVSPPNDVWNVRLQVAGVQFWYLDGGDVWRRVRQHSEDTQMNGAYWDGSFVGQGNEGANIRAEGTNQGWSVRLQPMETNVDYVSWHWFYSSDYYPRPAVPADCKAVFQAARIRLIQDSGNVNLSNAKFIASFGSDHWPAATGGKPDGKQITPFMQPRMRMVTPEWRWFTGHAFIGWFDGSGQPVMSQMGDQLITANPPPPIGRTHVPEA